MIGDGLLRSKAPTPKRDPAFPSIVGEGAALNAHMEETESQEMYDDGHAMSSPMTMFPEGAEIGSQLNCWSKPDASEFLVRGPQYLMDKKKVPSEDYLFPCRGVDLFLTDACPQDVGRNPGVMGGRLRELPTFIINFRLPWGVLLLYCEIPAKFLPFVGSSTAVTLTDELKAALNEMTPGERTAARWLMGDTTHKNKSLKIVPVVVDGPWVVKGVVGGKPALIGAKLPISYASQPAEGKEALYLEADLDIASSSAARGILSVARSYTQVLTLNLGFVIQGNEPDELPEQMLTGARLHGIDPLTAPALPTTGADMTQHLIAAMSDEESV
jgi:Protein ENHANCED DISEASE RESISTANCE 2, C-terminal